MTDPLSKRRLKLWIRLARRTRAAESQLREFLRVHHDTTLPRFDVMAALYRRRDGVTMSELSRMLLVSNGNVTTIVDRLENDGLVRRTPVEADRRTIFVALTPDGLATFEGLAADHERAVDPCLRRICPRPTSTRLTDILKRMRGSAMTALADLSTAATSCGR